MSRVFGDDRSQRDFPPAPPPHGTFVAWHRGCRCDECQAANRDFQAELEQRARIQRDWGEPAPRRLSADELAHLDPAVRARPCPSCGAMRYYRCRNPHFPQHFAATHPERALA
jgi:hypothetical protein